MRRSVPEVLVSAVVLATAVILVVLVRRQRVRQPVPRERDGEVAGRVLVGVAHPTSAEALGDLAAAVARADRGRVEAVCVVGRDPEADLGALADQTVSRCRTAVVDGGVEATGRVRVDASVAEGLLHHAVEFDASLVVLGWPQLGATELSALIDPAVRNVPAPLLLARLQGYRWERIRVSALEGPSDDGGRAAVRLAMQVSERIAETRGVPIVRERTTSGASTVGATVDDVAAELTVVPVSPHHDVVQRAVQDAPPFGDLLLALCHGPTARDQRPLLPAAERLYDATTSSPSP